MNFRTRRWAAVAVVFGVLAVTLVAENVAVNVLLPPLLADRPERVLVDYDLAWTFLPGWVHVRGLRVRVQGSGDQWVVTADRASGWVSPTGLRDHHLRLSEVTADGVRVKYRLRRAPGEVPGQWEPEITGLENPPDPAPEDLYPARPPWQVLVSTGALWVEEVWLQDYRWEGTARVGLECLFAETADARLEVESSAGSVWFGDQLAADRLVLSTTLALDGVPRRRSLGRDTLRYLSAQGRATADVGSLSFLESYLAAVPWLTVDGTGNLEAAWDVSGGTFRPGSRMTAWTDALAVGFDTYEARGDGTLSAWVDAGEAPLSHLVLAFGAFTVGTEGAPALIEGEGFVVGVTTADVSVAEPFTTAEVELDLPPSSLPDVSRFDALLPEGLGLSLTGGAATVTAHLAVTSEGVGAGVVDVAGESLQAEFDDLQLRFDLSLRAVLAEARVAEGFYDLSGTQLELRRVGLTDRGAGGAFTDSAAGGWWATAGVTDGWLRLGRPVALDTRLELRSADSSPYVRLAAQRVPLAPWVQELLVVPDVRGRGRLILGDGALQLRDFAVSAGDTEVRLSWLRRNRADFGAMYVRYGLLSLGLGVDGAAARSVTVVGAKRWFESRTGGGREPERARRNRGDSRRKKDTPPAER
jgi:hypothetical protein